MEPEQIFIITAPDQARILLDQVPQLSRDQYILEPMPRGTAAVVGLGAVALKHRDPESIMCVLTADHFITPIDQFQDYLTAALEVANQGYLVTLGIYPTYPSTGYGYVQRGEKIGEFNGLSAYEAVKFREKPNLENARIMISSGDHTWNSGMFFWRVDRILEELKNWMPELYEKLMEIDKVWGTPRQEEVLNRVWQSIQPQTIDYGIMEPAERKAVVPAYELKWNDVGSWESLFDVLPADDNGNIFLASHIVDMDTDNTLVYSGNEDRLVGLIGISNMIIVDTMDALLICPRTDSQKVKELVQMIRERGIHLYL